MELSGDTPGATSSFNALYLKYRKSFRDVPHSFSGTVFCEVPVGKGRKYAESSWKPRTRSLPAASRS